MFRNTVSGSSLRNVMIAKNKMGIVKTNSGRVGRMTSSAAKPSSAATHNTAHIGKEIPSGCPSKRSSTLTPKTNAAIANHKG